MSRMSSLLILIAMVVTAGSVATVLDMRFGLPLGQAMVLAGDPKAAGVLRGVTGADGTADLAHMWIILAKRKT